MFASLLMVIFPPCPVVFIPLSCRVRPWLSRSFHVATSLPHFLFLFPDAFLCIQHSEFLRSFSSRRGETKFGLRAVMMTEGKQGSPLETLILSEQVKIDQISQRTRWHRDKQLGGTVQESDSSRNTKHQRDREYSKKGITQREQNRTLAQRKCKIQGKIKEAKCSFDYEAKNFRSITVCSKIDLSLISLSLISFS